MESQETAHGVEDLDVDCVAINDNATIVSDESGSNNYELVYMLFSFVDVEADVELNELLAGYFKGAALALLNGKPKEMAEFLESNLHVVDNLVLHSNNKSVAEVLCKVLSIEDEYFASPALFSDARKNSLAKILNLIEDSSTDVYSTRQFTQTFCDLSDQSRDVSLACCSLEFLRRIFAISLGERFAAASAGVAILTRLLARDKSQLKAFLQEHLSDLPGSQESEELFAAVRDLLANFKGRLLEGEGVQTNQLGMEVRAFGAYRLRIVECVHALIGMNVFAVVELMYQLQYPKLLCDLFLLFPFNSVLHSLVYSIYKTILESENKSLLHVVVFCSHL